MASTKALYHQLTTSEINFQKSIFYQEILRTQLLHSIMHLNIYNIFDNIFPDNYLTSEYHSNLKKNLFYVRTTVVKDD